MGMFSNATKVKKKAKVLVYGDAGTGKTFFALSWPAVALIDTEGGADLYGGRYDFQVLRTKSLTDIVKAIEEVKRDNGKTIQTVVIDPITVVWQVLQEAGQQAAEDRATRYGRPADDVVLTQRDWGLIKRKLYAAMIDLVNLPINVVLTSHMKDLTETKRDSRGQDVQTKIGEKPDAEKKTAYWCDVVIKLAVEKGEHVGYVEKDRSGLFKIGQRIPNISYQHFLPLLEAHATGAVVQQPHEDRAIHQDAALIAEGEAKPQTVVKVQPTVKEEIGQILQEYMEESAEAYPDDIEVPDILPSGASAFLQAVDAHRAQLSRALYGTPYVLQKVLDSEMDGGFNWAVLKDEGARRVAYRTAMLHVRKSEAQAA